MMILMKEAAGADQVEGGMAHLRRKGHAGRYADVSGRAAVTVLGDTRSLCTRDIRLLDGVRDAIRLTVPWTLASRQLRPGEATVAIGGDVHVGGTAVVLMAGPCAVE